MGDQQIGTARDTFRIVYINGIDLVAGVGRRSSPRTPELVVNIFTPADAPLRYIIPKMLIITTAVKVRSFMGKSI